MAFRISSCEGIPGVGVTPGLMPFFIVAGSGIPGVGVAPLGKLVTVGGIPGVVFADGGIASGFRPSGMFAGSNATGPLELFEVTLTFEFEVADEPQPIERPTAINRPAHKYNFILLKAPLFT